MICVICNKDFPEEEFKSIPKDVTKSDMKWCPDCDKKDMEERLDNEIRFMRQ